MPATTRRPLEDQDPVVLELLRLAAEIILAHPGAVPPDLYELCDTWADDLAAVLSRPGSTPPHDHREADAPTRGRQGAPAASLLTAGTGARSITGGERAGATVVVTAPQRKASVPGSLPEADDQ